MTHILIVDDDTAFVLAVSESLQLRGYLVSSASDGAEALRKVDQHTPDLVLLDNAMPGMDGLRFCQDLRSNPRFHAMPVIFMSVRWDLADKLAAYEVGADDYLIKPFDMLELSARLQAVLRRSARQSTTDHERSLQAQLPAEPPVQATVVDKSEAVSERLLEVPGLLLHLDSAAVEVAGSAARLTPVEFDLLRFLLLHPDQILSAERLLQEVWLYPPGVGDSAVVRWHVKNLRRKIESKPDKPTRLCTISHHGYILVSRPQSVR